MEFLKVGSQRTFATWKLHSHRTRERFLNASFASSGKCINAFTRLYEKYRNAYKLQDQLIIRSDITEDGNSTNSYNQLHSSKIVKMAVTSRRLDTNARPKWPRAIRGSRFYYILFFHMNSQRIETSKHADANRQEEYSWFPSEEGLQCKWNANSHSRSI